MRQKITHPSRVRGRGVEVSQTLFYLKYKTAALISQNRRWSYGRVKGLLNDGFFSFAVVRQIDEIIF